MSPKDHEIIDDLIAWVRDHFTRGKPTGVPGEDEGWALDAADKVEHLQIRVQDLLREVARLKGGDRPDTHEFGCPLDGEIKTEPCPDCERALREIHMEIKEE